MDLRLDDLEPPDLAPQTGRNILTVFPTGIVLIPPHHDTGDPEQRLGELRFPAACAPRCGRGGEVRAVGIGTVDASM